MKSDKIIVIFSFTKEANKQNRYVSRKLSAWGYVCEGYTTPRLAGNEGLKPLDADMKTWVGGQWGKKAFLFIGAAGIAVRCIAPWVKDKYTDSAVLVMDERGDYVIPLLSGHMGGAVKITREIEKAVHATAVITTATDVRERFAVDVFAKHNELGITDRQLVTRISAAVLEEKPVGFYSELPVDGPLPEGLVWCNRIGELSDYAYGIAVVEKRRMGRQVSQDTERVQEPAGNILILEPFRTCKVTAGIGCRRGTSREQIASAFDRLLKEHHLGMEDIEGLASIDLKKDEPGILAFAKESHIPFYTYPAARLKEVPGEIEGSEFVSKVTGVDNVCERAARCCSPKGRLMQPKTVVDGITFALVEEKKTLTFG